MKTNERLLFPPLLILFVASVCLTTVTSGRAASNALNQPQAAKPTVLLVIADQWRAQAFGFAGDRNVKTPQLDRLASQSVCFVNAVAGLPVCCTTRASLLTGQRPLATGVFMN